MLHRIKRLSLFDISQLFRLLSALRCIKAWFALSIALFLYLLAPAASAQEPAVNADKIDEDVAQLSDLVAEVVPGILGYTRWPEDVADKRLCVLGPTEYADELLQSGIELSGWQAQVQRVSPDYDDIALNCQAIYIGFLLEEERNAIFSRLGIQPILTISEQNDSCVVNTLFCLRVEESNVDFAVNLDSVGRSGLRVHPNVLRLGRTPGEVQ